MTNKDYNFKQAKFFTTVNDLAMLPQQSVKEIAIVGRSNAGKSSLINTITHQNKLAFTSKTPGRTQHINYFELAQSGVFLVDLPGYGYAKVPEKIRAHWVGLLGNYLATRDELVGLVIIMDARHPLKPLDWQMLQFFAQNNNKPVHIVLSKSDKLTSSEKSMTMAAVKKELTQAGFSNYTLQLFSALKRLGVEELELVLNKLLK